MVYRILMLVLVLSVWCSLVPAQEESVAPGINDNFRNPNVDEYIKRFEGESRSIYAHRNDIVKALELKPGMAVADIGAGTGFFSLMISDEVGADGRVYAVDIAENFIEHIREISREHQKTNISAIVCDDHSAKLPENAVDLAFVCDTYHHFEYPQDTLASILSAVKPGGRLVIVDFVRIEGRTGEWALNHVRCGMGAVIDEVQQAGFDFLEKKDLGMPDQYVISFVKRPQEDQKPAE